MMRIKLPHGETDATKRYSMPDPDALAPLRESAYQAHFGLWPRALTGEEVVALLTLAEGYLALTTYELGQECCVGKLRDIWRARKAGAKT